MSKIKKKNDSISIVPEEEKTVRHEWEDYFNYNTFQMAPANNQTKKRLAMGLILYIKENKGCVNILEYLEHAGLDHMTWKRWCQADPEISRYHSMAKMMLAARREKGAINRDYDSNLITRSMAIYDNDWKELEEWRSKLSEGSEQGGTKIVIMEKFVEKEGT